MNEVKNSNENHVHGFNAWVKKHKKSILIVGGIVVAIGTGYAVYSSIQSLLKSIKPEPIAINNPQVSVKVTKSVVDDIPDPTVTGNKIIKDGEVVGVRKHIRNLSKGCNASLEKTTLASEHGFTLKEHQTWVKDYSKNWPNINHL